MRAQVVPRATAVNDERLRIVSLSWAPTRTFVRLPSHTLFVHSLFPTVRVEVYALLSGALLSRRQRADRWLKISEQSEELKTYNSRRRVHYNLTRAYATQT